LYCLPWAKFIIVYYIFLNRASQQKNNRVRGKYSQFLTLAFDGGEEKFEDTKGTISYSSYKPGDRSWMREKPDCDYDKRNIFMVICDTDIP
jgi:hypothetical protein